MKMLGTLGGNSSWAVAINNTGQVVGRSSTANGAEHGFITGPNGVGMTDLGLTINPTALNDAGQVVGDLVPFGEYGPFHGFITGPNGVGITQLGSLAPGQREQPRGINNLGQVVGRTESYNGVTQAFITGPNGVGMRDLGNLDLGGFYNAGEDINDTGQVIGYSSTASNEYHAFITGPDGVGMTDIGTLSGDWSWATAINDAGQVVGNFIPPGSTYEFTLAFISDSSGGTVDLNSLVHLPGGALLTQAIDINNPGQILVTSGIPAPATYALLLAGLGLVGFMARRTKSNRWSDKQAWYRSRSKSVSASPRASCA